DSEAALFGFRGNTTAGFEHAEGFFRIVLQCLDQGNNFIGGLASATGECAHFIGYHRESSPIVTSACSLNGGIKSQQVRLLCDTGNYRHNAVDGMAGVVEIAHALG